MNDVHDIPKQLAGVTVVTKANLYFEGKVASHTILLPHGVKKTIGLIYPGSFHFKTGVPEHMEIVAGLCRVQLDGEQNWTAYGAGNAFSVTGNSGFKIEVTNGVCEYICSFLK
jgi:uncharacterized protein YaiE (UPF0345 family)